jgi:hypothetical protein
MHACWIKTMCQLLQLMMPRRLLEGQHVSQDIYGIAYKSGDD